MKKRFWKISSLAWAAVVSACAVTASAASVVDSSRSGELFSESDKEAEYRANPKHTVAPYMLETTESGLTVYEEALLAGDYSLGCGTVECSGEHFCLGSSTTEEEKQNAAAVSSTESTTITLDEVDDVDYTLWSGRYTYYGDLSAFKWDTSSPNCFNISGNGRKITMHSYYDYRTLYKKVNVRLTYLGSDGKLTYITASNDGTSQDIVVTGNFMNGTLVEIAAYCYMYNASSASTGFKEVAVVHILHKNYVPLAIKNNEPYAHLIDEYTPI